MTKTKAKIKQFGEKFQSIDKTKTSSSSPERLQEPEFDESKTEFYAVFRRNITAQQRVKGQATTEVLSGNQEIITYKDFEEGKEIEYESERYFIRGRKKRTFMGEKMNSYTIEKAD